MANLSQIKLPNGVTYNLKDNGALQLTGGSVTGPVSFGDSVSIDEATVGDLVVNGSASFTNNLQANTINGVTVGSNPKFTDTNTVTTATTTGSGNAVTAVTASNGALTITKGSTFLTGSSTLDASKLSGAIPSAVTATTQASTDNSAKIATTAYVTTAIANLPITDTKNTAGSTDTSSKIFLIGATSQSANPQTYSHDSAYVGTDGCLYSGSAKVSVEGHYHTLGIAVYTPSEGEAMFEIAPGKSYEYSVGSTSTTFSVEGVSSVNNKTGVVSLTASDVGALASNTTYVSKITTTAGAHSAISNKSGAVSFNVPTKTSHLTNDSNFITGITKAMVTTALGTGSGTTKFLREDGSWATPAYIENTDEKLRVVEITSATQYYPIVGTVTSGTAGAIRQHDTTGFKYKGTTGTTSAVGSATLELGNSTASGTAGNKQGQLIMHGSNANQATITLAAPSTDIALALPTSAGTLALTSQIPTVPTATKSKVTGITASTTATKTTLGTAFTIPNVTSVGSASTWTFSATTVGDGTLVGTIDSSDSSMLVITAGTKSVQQKTGGGNGTAPTLGTAFTVPNVTGNTSATVSVTDPGHTHSI